MQKKSLFFALCHMSNMQIFNEFSSIVRSGALDVLHRSIKHARTSINNGVYCALKAQFSSWEEGEMGNK
jgi:hypothetical protein